MEGGRFVIALILILIVGGGSGYYSYTEIGKLQAQVASLQAKIQPINQNSVTAGNLANAAKTAADAAKADAAKANAAIDQINQTITEMKSKPAPAAPAKKK